MSELVVAAVPGLLIGALAGFVLVSIRDLHREITLLRGTLLQLTAALAIQLAPERPSFDNPDDALAQGKRSS